VPNALAIRAIVFKVVLVFLQVFVPTFARAIREEKAAEDAISEAIAAFLHELARQIGLNVAVTLPMLYVECMKETGGEQQT
jgi:hypothetical protein